MKYKSTKEMNRHLLTIHPGQIKVKEKKKPQQEDIQYFLKCQPLTPTQHARINEEAASLIATPSCSFNILNNEHLKNLLQIINPDAKLNSYSHIKDVVLTNVYEKEKEKRKREVEELLLSSEGHVSLTTDSMTKNNHSYYCITGHFSTSTFTPKSVLLEFKEIYPRHNAEEIEKEVIEIKKLFSFKSIDFIVADGASNNL